MSGNQELVHGLDSLNQTLAGIWQSLSVLSAAKIAEEFYTKEEREAFYTEYEQRMAEAAKARLIVTRGKPTQEMVLAASKAHERVMECRAKSPALVTLHKQYRPQQ